MAKRRNHEAPFEAPVALEALKGEKTTSELVTAYGEHPTMIHLWKKALLEGAADIFERGPKKTAEVDEEAVRDLNCCSWTTISEPRTVATSASSMISVLSLRL